MNLCYSQFLLRVVVVSFFAIPSFVLRTVKRHFLVIRAHNSPPTSFTTPLPLTMLKSVFGSPSLQSYNIGWEEVRGRGTFLVESSECYEGAITMAEKMPCRVNVSTAFVTYGSSHKVQNVLTGAVIRIIATSNAAASNAQTGQRSDNPFNKFYGNGTPMQPRCKSHSGCGHRVKRKKIIQHCSTSHSHLRQTAW